jgi:quercetin dioxygenase-like cupin family protein
MPATVTSHMPIWFIDSRATVHITGDETEGNLGLIEMESPKGHMPPLHVHHEEDQAFTVLEGELTLYVGGDIVRLGAGETALGPKGVPHTFRVESEGARFITVSAPSGFERFVLAASRPAEADGLPPVEVVPEDLVAIGREFGVELLGPPGALPS